MEDQTNKTIGLAELLSDLRLGELREYKNLKIFPLFSSYSKDNGYVLLKDALDNRKFIVTGLNNAASVRKSLILKGCKKTG
ncbi:MAG: hypothetical protein HY758_09695 [Nitrospirae bacterium]|nr:hypothetical protein [Nitrospirota bacterium]